MAAVATSKIDFSAAMDWASPLIAYVEPYSSFLLAAMIVLPPLIALYSGNAGSLVEAFILGLLIWFAVGEGEPVFVLLLFAMAIRAAVNGFRRRKDEHFRLEIRKDIGDLRKRVEDFLDALDRRTKDLDLALADATSTRDLNEGDGVEEHGGTPTRLHNAPADTAV
jgi:hypothetical protein